MDAFYFETNELCATIAFSKKYVEVVATSKKGRWTKIMRTESKKYANAHDVWNDLLTHGTMWDVVKTYDWSNNK